MWITSRGRWMVLAALVSVVCAGTACDDDDDDDLLGDGTGSGDGSGFGATTAAFAREDLVSDDGVGALRADPDLVNGWGIVAADNWLWIAAEDTGKVAIYDGDGNPATGTFTSGAIDLGEGITGVVADVNRQFMIGSGPNCPPAELIFASTNGQLIAFNHTKNPTGGTVVVDREGAAVYTGVAIAGNHVLAADLAGKKLDVFDTSFAAATDLADGAFTDPTVPADYGPFNVMTFGTEVFVTYAVVDPATGDEVPGAGLGIVNAYDVNGHLLRRVATGGVLDAPWGMAIAPASFGVHGGQLLIGNFGDGRITAFDLTTSETRGQIADLGDTPIVIDGLWGITSGAGGTAGSPDVLYFAAGPDDEAHGLYGRIITVSTLTATAALPTADESQRAPL
jgi:uncharacterized protein (TIGR03118 family)